MSLSPSADPEILRKTYSLCPVCLARLPAEIIKREDELIGVTPVPTIVPGVNDQNVGEILDFGLSN